MTHTQTRHFAVRATPGSKASSFQFASMVMFHLKCESHGMDCDMFKDWDGKSLFWFTDWMDWSEHRESEVLESLRFFARRFLREQKIPEQELDSYVKFEVLTV